MKILTDAGGKPILSREIQKSSQFVYTFGDWGASETEISIKSSMLESLDL